MKLYCNAQVRAMIGIALCASLFGQVPFRSKKVKLRRMLPPAVELEAKSFTIEATAQDKAAVPIATSFREMFRAKIQGDSRFIYTDTDPSLRVSIALTRFYIEPKRLTNGKTDSCMTHAGNLQGTMRVVDVATGKPLASDTIGWKLQVGRTKHLVTADDGREIPVSGPKEKLTAKDFYASQSESSGLINGGLGGTIGRFTKAAHPCDLPLTMNEAQDILADAFLTEIIQMATPYTVELELTIPSNRAIGRGVEEAVAGEWSKALEVGLGCGVVEKKDEESERLYLMALSHEALGYKQGESAFEVQKKVQSKLPPDELVRQQTELRRIVDLAKEHFDKAAELYGQANGQKNDESYRAGERRADQSRKLYARIQKYRDLKSEPPPPPPSSRIGVSQILAMCADGVTGPIIAHKIEHAPNLDVTTDHADQFAKCGPIQNDIFTALQKREASAKQPAGVTPEIPPATRTITEVSQAPATVPANQAVTGQATKNRLNTVKKPAPKLP